jgi:peptidoglycan-associated lipoprotein
MSGSAKRGRLLLLALPFLWAGCSVLSRKAAPSKAASAADAGGRGSSDEADQQEASLRLKKFSAVPDLTPIYFDYDRAQLAADAFAALKRNAVWLKEHPKAEIQVQGHCDERGTAAYNLSLGQRRALAIRDYYKALGIEMRRMSTISFGEESPACREPTEDCWRRNRRGETMVRTQDKALGR